MQLLVIQAVAFFLEQFALNLHNPHPFRIEKNTMPTHPGAVMLNAVKHLAGEGTGCFVFGQDKQD